MLFKTKNNDNQGIIDALNASQAVIELTPEGVILDANKNFTDAIGYDLSEMRGKHHSMLCDPEYAKSEKYKRFWPNLASGVFNSGEFMRIGKGGRIIWIQASYNPIKDNKGNVIKVITFATDITEQKNQATDAKGKIDAINRSQAVIEFTPNGDIIWANDNFLKALGYRLDEIKSKHHRIFCDPSYVNSTDYQVFWDNLRAGKFQQSEYKRITKSGQPIFIQASYNPIFDDNGRVIKVVKFATDITATVQKRIRNENISQNINRDLIDVVNQVSSANEMAARASNASSQTGAIVNSVAAASEELSQSVREIAQNMSNAQRGVGSVFQHTETANHSAEELTKSASSMNNIVTIIQEIAQQINMLALNATIESARAGEAGKGFAVVASEVKTLANQTTSSTQTISAEIANMQNISNEVVQSLGIISNNMNSVLENVASVASAIEEQAAVTSDISNNMQQAVGAVSEIAHSLEEINMTFNTVASSSEKVKVDVETLVA